MRFFSVDGDGARWEGALCVTLERTRVVRSTSNTSTVFDRWQGKFHDGSGAFGTYINNQNSYYLIDPCKEATAAGSPCRVLLWFEVFDTEPIYDTMTIFDG